MVRQLGQAPLVPGGIPLEEVVGQPFFLDNVQQLTGKWGGIKVIHRFPLNGQALPPVVTGQKSTAYGQFEKETPPRGTHLRISAQTSKKAHQRVLVVEVVDDQMASAELLAMPEARVTLPQEAA